MASYTAVDCVYRQQDSKQQDQHTALDKAPPKTQTHATHTHTHTTPPPRAYVHAGRMLMLHTAKGMYMSKKRKTGICLLHDTNTVFTAACAVISHSEHYRPGCKFICGLCIPIEPKGYRARRLPLTAHCSLRPPLDSAVEMLWIAFAANSCREAHRHCSGVEFLKPGHH